MGDAAFYVYQEIWENSNLTDRCSFFRGNTDLISVSLGIRPQCDDRIFLRSDPRREQSCNDSEQHTDDDEDDCACGRELCDTADVGQVLNDHIDRNVKQYRDDDADHSGTESDDQGLGIEYTRNVAFRCADTAQDADLFCPFEYRDIGDDTDHNRGYDKGDADKRNQDIGDRIDDRAD